MSAKFISFTYSIQRIYRYFFQRPNKTIEKVQNCWIFAGYDSEIYRLMLPLNKSNTEKVKQNTLE